MDSEIKLRNLGEEFPQLDQDTIQDALQESEGDLRSARKLLGWHIKHVEEKVKGLRLIKRSIEGRSSIRFKT